MATYLPTLKQLQYLVALKDHGHFGRAAEACFVTQSTLSAGLRELESLIGITLVERTRRVVRFTPLGLRIAEKAQRVLREAEELGDLARAAGKPLSGDLRMGVIPTIAPFLLPRILPRLRAAWPDLKLYLREETTSAACDSLHRGHLDCVLLALPYHCGDIESVDLFLDRLFVAFPQGEMTSKAPTITAADIDETPLSGEAPGDYVQRLARSKAGHIFGSHRDEMPVLGADTTVAIDGLALGKPADDREHRVMFERLSAREHAVYSAVALATSAGVAVRLSVTRVVFRAVTESERATYWASGEPRDKAGGYAIQGLGAIFIESIAGSYSGVMGLPLAETAALLVAAGVPIWQAET